MLRLFSRVSGVARAAAAQNTGRVVVATRSYSGMESMSDSEFNSAWTEYFKDETLDSLGVRMGLNKLFAQDAVPSNEVLINALNACRRANDYSTSVRIFEAVRDKVPDSATYSKIISDLKPIIDELGLDTPEELGLSK